MIVVGICRLAGAAPSGEDAAILARETGTAIYDARLKLAQPVPIIALRTTNKEAAISLLRCLRARGHQVVACDDTVPVEPSPVRTFHFDDGAFHHDKHSLAYDGIVALVRATRALRTETTEKVTERKFRPGAALISGGLIMSKKVTRQEKHVAHDKEDLLYVFDSSAAWLITERGTVYTSLDGLAPTQRENFMRVVRELRTRAPLAIFDEHLLAHKGLEQHDIDFRARLIAIAAVRATPS